MEGFFVSKNSQNVKTEIKSFQESDDYFHIWIRLQEKEKRKRNIIKKKL